MVVWSSSFKNKEIKNVVRVTPWPHLSITFNTKSVAHFDLTPCFPLCTTKALLCFFRINPGELLPEAAPRAQSGETLRCARAELPPLDGGGAAPLLLCSSSLSSRSSVTFKYCSLWRLRSQWPHSAWKYMMCASTHTKKEDKILSQIVSTPKYNQSRRTFYLPT